MANLLTNNPIRIDTAMLTSWKAQIAASNGTFYDLRIEKIEWKSPVTATTDTFSIEDQNAFNLLQGTCEVAGQSQIWDWTAKPKRWRDFTVNQISSGVLWIWLT
jgi:hypothetical protein